MNSLCKILIWSCLHKFLFRPFWAGAAANAVVIEADAFKESDVIYKALSSRGHHNDMLRTAELVNICFLNSQFKAIKMSLAREISPT